MRNETLNPASRIQHQRDLVQLQQHTEVVISQNKYLLFLVPPEIGHGPCFQNQKLRPPNGGPSAMFCLFYLEVHTRRIHILVNIKQGECKTAWGTARNKITVQYTTLEYPLQTTIKLQGHLSAYNFRASIKHQLQH